MQLRVSRFCCWSKMWRGESSVCQLVAEYFVFCCAELCSDKMFKFPLALFVVQLCVVNGYEVTLNTGYKIPLIGRESEISSESKSAVSSFSRNLPHQRNWEDGASDWRCFGCWLPTLWHGSHLSQRALPRICIQEAFAEVQLEARRHFHHNEDRFDLAFRFSFAIHSNLSLSVPSPDYKTEADYQEFLRRSLTNLQTNYIDLFLIHWPGEFFVISQGLRLKSFNLSTQAPPEFQTLLRNW